MKDQHEKIKNFRDLNEQEVAAMNAVKGLEEHLGELWHRVRALPDVDPRSVHHARTVLQDGLMWLVRAVARPVSAFDDDQAPDDLDSTEWLRPWLDELEAAIAGDGGEAQPPHDPPTNAGDPEVPDPQPRS